MNPLIETPETKIKAMELVIRTEGVTARVRRWAERRLLKARTDQLRQECAIPVKLQSKETA